VRDLFNDSDDERLFMNYEDLAAIVLANVDVRFGLGLYLYA